MGEIGQINKHGHVLCRDAARRVRRRVRGRRVRRGRRGRRSRAAVAELQLGHPPGEETMAKTKEFTYALET